MGSAAKTAEETVDYLRAQGEKVGILKVHLFRPFSTEHFLAELPESVKAIAVLDRTKDREARDEDLAPSLPLHADVLTAMSEAGVYKKVVGGNYGLGSKEFAPRRSPRERCGGWIRIRVPKRHFTVGINDDVTNTSLQVGPIINTQDPEVTQAIFFGLGSDGTVGANKAAAAIIGERTEFYSQARGVDGDPAAANDGGHFNYSSQKAGASTVSHLRFGPKPIRSEYEIEGSPGADYVACHHTPTWRKKKAEAVFVDGLERFGGKAGFRGKTKRTAIISLGHPSLTQLQCGLVKYLVIHVAQDCSQNPGAGRRLGTCLKLHGFHLPKNICFVFCLAFS
ncbi:unnamed protein product [Effrenium voratum]|nr:unnamed protein product [Effrenium voratum]